MNSKEIIEKLESYEGSETENDYYNSRNIIGHCDLDSDHFESVFGKFEYVLQAERSNSGDHDEAETVIYFHDHDVFILLDGWYSSQEGTSFEDGEYKEVYPKTKKVEYYSTEK